MKKELSTSLSMVLGALLLVILASLLQGYTILQNTGFIAGISVLSLIRMLLDKKSEKVKISDVEHFQKLKGHSAFARIISYVLFGMLTIQFYSIRGGIEYASFRDIGSMILVFISAVFAFTWVYPLEDKEA